ncbi:unnamed protein product [Malus baccata var. baccata]
MSDSTVALPINLIPDEASPAWMNKGDNAWQLTAATLVGLQSIPGLMILYGGAVKKKWAVNSAFMGFYAFACVLVCWVGWGYHMSFGDALIKNIPFWGKPNVALNQQYLLGIAFSGKIPNATMVYFQFVFAAITLILIAGALLGRMNFYAWMLSTGGYVIHLSSGAAGFTAAYWVGPRSNKDRERFPPNNILLMLTGAGLLWMGWTGFNGGDPYVVSVDASLAVLNTHICTATSLLTWLLLDITFFRKPSVIGAVQGMITGLVCITPAAGVVQGWAAIIMGIFSGSIPWFTMMKVDDTMAVLHTHAIAGALGGILTGLFAHPRLSFLFYTKYGQYVGLFYGFHMGEVSTGFRQVGIQLLGIFYVVTLNVVVTSIICLVIQSIMPLRMSTEDMEIGDEAAHGEEAYAIWGQGEKLGNSKSGYDIESSAAKSRKAARQIEMV